MNIPPPPFTPPSRRMPSADKTAWDQELANYISIKRASFAAWEKIIEFLEAQPETNIDSLLDLIQINSAWEKFPRKAPKTWLKKLRASIVDGEITKHDPRLKLCNAFDISELGWKDQEFKIIFSSNNITEVVSLNCAQCQITHKGLVELISEKKAKFNHLKTLDISANKNFFSEVSTNISLDETCPISTLDANQLKASQDNLQQLFQSLQIQDSLEKTSFDALTLEEINANPALEVMKILYSKESDPSRKSLAAHKLNSLSLNSITCNGNTAQQVLNFINGKPLRVFAMNQLALQAESFTDFEVDSKKAKIVDPSRFAPVILKIAACNTDTAEKVKKFFPNLSDSSKKSLEKEETQQKDHPSYNQADLKQTIKELQEDYDDIFSSLLSVDKAINLTVLATAVGWIPSFAPFIKRLNDLTVWAEKNLKLSQHLVIDEEIKKIQQDINTLFEDKRKNITSTISDITKRAQEHEELKKKYVSCIKKQQLQLIIRLITVSSITLGPLLLAIYFLFLPYQSNQKKTISTFNQIKKFATSDLSEDEKKIISVDGVKWEAQKKLETNNSAVVLSQERKIIKQNEKRIRRIINDRIKNILIQPSQQASAKITSTNNKNKK